MFNYQPSEEILNATLEKQTYIKHIDGLIKQAVNKKNIILRLRIFGEMLGGDPKGALLLNQILYWADRTNDPEGWFYKTYADWEEELGFKESVVRRIIKGDSRIQNPKITLAEVGIETTVKDSPTGKPTVHYRVNAPIFFAFLVDYLEREYALDLENEVEQAATPNPDNAEDTSCATQDMQSVHCTAETATLPYKDSKTISESTPIISRPTTPDDDWYIFSPFEKHFGKANTHQQKALKSELARLGNTKTQEVIERCVKNKARSWAYVIKSLENEAGTRESNATGTKRYADTVVNITPERFEAWLAERQAEKQEYQREEIVAPFMDTVIERDFLRPMTVQDIWETAYTQMELQLGKSFFDTWLHGAQLVDFEANTGTFVVRVRNQYAQDMCQKRYYRNIRRILSDVYGQAASVRFEVYQVAKGVCSYG